MLSPVFVKPIGGDPIYIVRNHVRAKDVLTNVLGYARAKDNRDLIVTAFRPLHLDFDDEGCTFRSDGRSREFKFESFRQLIDQHGRIFAGVLDSEIDITGDESVDELRILTSTDGRELRTLEPGRVSFEERPGDLRAIMLMAGFKVPGLPIYCFDFSPEFLRVRPNLASRVLHATESWRDALFRPQMKAGVEATVGSYAVFYRGDRLSMQLYSPAMAGLTPALDGALKIESPVPTRLENGVLTVEAGRGATLQPLRFGLAGDAFQRDEVMEYEFTLYRLGE